VKKIEGSREERRERLDFAWRALADAIIDNCGESRERSLALTNAEQAVMWTREAVARTE